ncbi:MAG: PilZ domain-containing protein [Nitrospirota bacterium]
MEARPQPPANQDPASDHHKDRRGRRMLLSCRLFFFGEDDFEGEATLLDISASGCRAGSSIPLEIGMILRLSLFLPDHQWPLRINQAIVRWIDHKEFGLEFIDITMAQRERLRTLVMKVR